MRVFTRVMERGSFIRAAEDLTLPASSVTEAVKMLEARLGTRLLQRTTRQVRATPEGQAYYQRCLSILADIEEAESGLSATRPRGLLRVDAQGTQARRVILPRLSGFFAAYPEITLHLSETDRFVDLVREGIDCVLRGGTLRESDLISRRIAVLPEATLASPAYIAAHGLPRRWDDLAGHHMIGFHSSATGGVLPLEFMVDGARRLVTLPSILTVSGAETYQAAALEGFGLIQVPRDDAAAHIAAGRLMECLAETPPSPTAIHLLYPRGRQVSPRLRVFIDWIAAEYARDAGGATAALSA